MGCQAQLEGSLAFMQLVLVEMQSQAELQVITCFKLIEDFGTFVGPGLDPPPRNTEAQSRAPCRSRSIPLVISCSCQQ